MKVQSCARSAGVKKERASLSWGQIQKYEGVYQPVKIDQCFDRIIVIHSAGSIPTVILFRDQQLITPQNWENELFIKTNEEVCFELRRYSVDKE